MTVSLEQYATGRFEPSTYLERGISLPFTTPVLLGARVRPAERQTAELILSHPGGGDGVYVLPWAGLPDICAPTLHDRALWAKVANLPMLTPATIREAALSVAARGLAGRAAARAASEAVAAARHGRTLAHYQLLLTLVRQGEGGTGIPPERDTPANIQLRAHAVLKRLRSAGSLPPSAAVEALEELAAVFEGCGLPGDPTKARLPRLAADVAALAIAAGDRADRVDGDLRVAANLLREGAELTLRFARSTIEEAQQLTAELWTLLHRWRETPDEITAIVARPDWILDGWETICGIRRLAAPDAVDAAIVEMALLVPVVPVEAKRWVGTDLGAGIDADGLRRWRRTVKPQEDWMTGRLLELTTRNEKLRAVAA